MPSRKHNALVHVLLEQPELLIDLVRRNLGVRLPKDLEVLRGPETVRLGFSDRIADGAIVLRRRGGGVGETIVLEVQLRRDPRKRKAWAIYVVGTWAQLDGPATLVIMTPSPSVARWAAQPIDIGHGLMVLRPLVIGPEHIDAEPTLEDARACPQRLALSVIVHGHKSGSLRLGRIALKVAQELLASRDDRSMVLADIIASFVNARVRRSVEAEMGIADGYVFGTAWGKAYGKMRAKALAEGESEGLAKGLAKGESTGLAKALRTVLRGRGLEPTKAQWKRIARCRDTEQLEKWLARAMVAETVAEVLRR